MQKVAFSAKELSEMGVGSESHVRRMIKAGEIRLLNLGTEVDPILVGRR